jgi:hypothetical protein
MKILGGNGENEKFKQNTQFGRSRCRQEDNIKKDIRVMGC